MAKRTHVCRGCGARLAAKRDLAKEQGQVHATWLCRICRTKVPPVVAEKIRQQRQH